MEISNVNSIQSANPTSNTNLTGAVAPQTEAQRADVSATRVVSTADTADIESRASSSAQHRFEAVKSKAVQMTKGENPFLNDMVFTIYGGEDRNAKLGQDVIRFTDI
jgi:hypothetical protein